MSSEVNVLSSEVKQFGSELNRDGTPMNCFCRVDCALAQVPCGAGSFA